MEGWYMNRESDEACLALIASIRDERSGRPQWREIDCLLDNLEARIKDAAGWVGERSALWAEIDRSRKREREQIHLTGDYPCGTERCREAWRELGQAKPEEATAAIRFRDVIREEVAAEVAVQLEVAFARLYAFVASPSKAQEAEAS
jgi:hypothetical protein